MTTPCSGTIAMSDINVELGRGWNLWLDLNYGPVRQLAGRGATGFVAFSDLRCKSRYIREPASGDYYEYLKTCWKNDWDSAGRVEAWWFGTKVFDRPSGTGWTVNSYAPGDGWTYHKGDHRSGGTYPSDTGRHGWWGIIRDRWN